MPDGAEGDVFTAADNGFGSGEIAQLRAEPEGFVDTTIKANGAVAGGVEGPGAVEIEPGDLTFEDGTIDATGPGPVDVGDGGALFRIRDDLAGFDGAAEESGEFGVGDEAEAAGEIVARDDAVALDGDRARVGAEGPGVGTVAETPAEEGGLPELTGLAPEVASEGGDAFEWRLFGDEDDFGAALAQVGSDGEEQRAAAGDDDAFAGDGEAAFDHGLEAAGAEDVRERPAGKGQETLAGAGGEDDAVGRGELAGGVDLDAGADGDAGIKKTVVSLRDAAAPDLAAEGGIVIEECDLVADLRGGPGGGETGGTTADDEGARHRWRPPCR